VTTLGQPLPSGAPSGTAPLSAVHDEMLAAVLGHHGLERVASLATAALGGGRVVIVVPAAEIAVAWPDRGGPAVARLAAYVARRLRGQPAQVPDGLVKERAVTMDGDAVGLVLLLGEDPARPDADDVLHLAATAVVVGMALGAGAEARRDIAAALVGDLLEHPGELSPPDVLLRARRAGADLSRGAVGCFAAGGLRAEAAIREEFPNALVRRDGRHVHALLAPRDNDPDGRKTMRAALRLAERLEGAALSPYEPYLSNLGRALREARLAAAARKAGAGHPARANSGIYRLLLRIASEHPDELRRYCAETVDPIEAYDAANRTQLLATVRTFLDHDGSISAAAATMCTHRHTIGYRLARIRELTGLDLTRTADREQVGVGLKASALLRGI
jgi:hypothetical protein